MMSARKTKGNKELSDQVPTPSPQIQGMARRLEGVRKSKDLSLNAWHALLSKREGFHWSYEGIRLYHREDHQREPPVSYLIHVSREFGVELDYLATGEGSVKRLFGGAVDEGDDLRLVREGAGWFFESVDDATEFRFRQTWERVVRAMMDTEDLTPPRRAEVGILILELAREPLRVFGQPEDGDPTFLRTYFSGAFEAIETAVPKFEMGPTYYAELMARAKGEPVESRVEEEEGTRDVLRELARER